MLIFFFFKQKTAYEMRISDWSSDVCSSDLLALRHDRTGLRRRPCQSDRPLRRRSRRFSSTSAHSGSCTHSGFRAGTLSDAGASAFGPREPEEDHARKIEPERQPQENRRSEEHTSELQSLMRISYAVFC